MAPAAFTAYMRACESAGIHPHRIGQTIGDHPRSVGYHARDGVLNLNGQRVDYTAAVDLGVQDLDRASINKFLNALSAHGFANWYREGPRWKGGEHVHAIYAALPMKAQLRRQVREFLKVRRAAKIKPHGWEENFRHRR